jgi:drug/metabolite transporter (DMT)-like permease
MTRPTATLLLLLTALIWGLAFTAQKSGMATMGPLTFAAVRYLLGGAIILPLALREYRRRDTPLTRQHWTLILGLSAAFFIGSWLQQLGLTMTTVTNSGFLTALYVLFVPIIGFIAMRTRPHPVVWLCVPLALCGTFLLNGGKFDQFNFGDVLILICAVFWAVQVLMLGHTARATGMPVFISAVGFILAGAIALPLALAFEAPTVSGIAAGWLQLGYAAIFATAIAFTLQAVGQQYVPAANSAVILSAESLFAALGGAVILGDRLPAIGYLGAALIFIAILLVEVVPATAEARRERRAA